MAPALPGFAAVVNVNIHVSTAAQNVFALTYIEGLAVSFTVHSVINQFFLPVGVGDIEEQDYFGTFPVKEAKALDIIPHYSLFEGVEADDRSSGTGSQGGAKEVTHKKMDTVTEKAFDL